MLFHGDLPCQRAFSWKVGAFSWGPSMLEADFQEGRCFFRVTFHARGRFPGRSVLFHGDLPCQRSISRKVLRFCRGPSLPEVDFQEGRCFFMGTFHARSHFPGRSVLFQGDLPCQRPFSWKVGAFSWEHSMPGIMPLKGLVERGRNGRVGDEIRKKEQGRDEKHFCISKIFIIFVIRTNPCKDDYTNSGDLRATG